MTKKTYGINQKKGNSAYSNIKKKVDFRTKKIIKDKEHYSLVKQSIHQENNP